MNKSQLQVASGLILLALLQAACQGSVDFGVLTPSSRSQGINQSVLPNCAVQQPQIQFYGNINSFELSDSNNFQFGFTAIKAGQPLSVGIGTKIKKMSLDLSLFAIDPLSHQILAPSQVTSDQTQSDINATIDFKGIQLGLNNYNSTPMGTVSMNALSKAVTQIVSTLNKNQGQQWFARVQSVLNKDQIIINAGSNSNLAVGDEFNVFNVIHTQPCTAGDMVIRSPEAPVATVKVTQVSSAFSVASVTLKGAVMPQIGSEIRILTGSQKSYKRSASLGGISSKPLTLADGSTIDLQSTLNNQLVSALFNDFLIVQ